MRFLIALLLLLPAVLSASTGRVWVKLSDTEKTFYVFGVVDGYSLRDPKSKTGFIRAKGATAADLVRIVDQYYSDSANVLIPVKNMIDIANRRLAGDNEQDLNGYLLYLRKFFAE